MIHRRLFLSAALPALTFQPTEYNPDAAMLQRRGPTCVCAALMQPRRHVRSACARAA